MGDWPLGDGQRYEAGGIVAASTALTTITASGSAHTKGSWTELLASSAFAASGLWIGIGRTGSANARYLLDIGIGASGSEVVLVPDIIVQTGQTGSQLDGLFVPVAVPDSTRISARCQAGTGSQFLTCSVSPVGVGFAGPVPLGRVTAYGVASATTAGAVVDAGGTANTKGAYTEIVASTTNRIRALIIGTGYRVQNVAALRHFLTDLAIGSSGSEQVLIPDLYFGNDASLRHIPRSYYGPFPITIPAGTRLATRCQCDSTTATERTFETILYGID